MKKSLPIISDIYSAQELFDLFQEHQGAISFALEPNDQTVRSPFSDPTVLVALIGAGATTLASLITLFGVIWSTKRKEKKENADLVIEIKLNQVGMNKVNSMEAVKKKVLNALLSSPEREQNTLRLPDIGEATSNQTYEDIFNELFLEDIEHVTILGDE